jgi:hypothetical protein
VVSHCVLLTVICPDKKGHGIWEHLTVICRYMTSYDGICQVIRIPDGCRDHTDIRVRARLGVGVSDIGYQSSDHISKNPTSGTPISGNRDLKSPISEARVPRIPGRVQPASDGQGMSRYQYIGFKFQVSLSPGGGDSR